MMGGAMMVLPLMFNSCEDILDDIFGEWSRPTNQHNNEPTKVSGSTNSKTYLASTAAIPETWKGLTLFYVKKSTSSSSSE